MASIDEKIKKIDWYHCIDLGGGVVTDGFNKNIITGRLGLPDDLTGKTVLDIGAWDGLHSFECEKRGAKRVLATDSLCWSKKPFKEGKDLGCGSSGKNGTLGTKQGFLTARELLGSKVEDKHIKPENIAVDTVGGFFDITLFLGVLYHMKNPVAVMQATWSVTKELMIIESHVDERFGNEIPCAAFYPGDELNHDATNWWGPNRVCLEAMIRTLDPAPTKVWLNDFDGKRAIFHAWR